MRRDKAIFGEFQRRFWIHRLFRKHIEICGGDFTAVERVGEVTFIHNGPARSIYKYRRRLHNVQKRGVDDALGLISQRAVKREKIRLFCSFCNVGGLVGAVFRLRSGTIWLQ